MYRIDPSRLASFTQAELAAITPASGSLAYASDLDNGESLGCTVFFDGTLWRRLSDAIPVSEVNLPDHWAKTALMARFSGTYSTERQREINRLITTLDNAGIWYKLSQLLIFNAPVESDALLNWKSTTFNATAVGSPTFTADVGYNSRNGTSQYINTNLTMSTAAELNNVAKVSAGFWTDTTTFLSASDADFGSSDSSTSSNVSVLATSTEFYFGINTGTVEVTTSNIAGEGLVVASRNDNDEIVGAVQGIVQRVGFNSALSGMNSRPLFLGAYNNDGTASLFGTRLYSAFFVGRSLTEAQIKIFDSALRLYFA